MTTLFGNTIPTTGEAPALFDVEDTDTADDVRHLLLTYAQALDDVHNTLNSIRYDLDQADRQLTPSRVSNIHTFAAIADAKRLRLQQLRDRLDTRHIDAWVQRVEQAGPGRHTLAARQIIAESLAADAAMIADLERGES